MIGRIRKYLLTVDDCEDTAQLILGYQLWVDPDDRSIESIILYAKENGYNVPSRKQNLVDCRSYLYAYITCKFDIGSTDIGRLFKRDHSSISNSLSSFSSLISDKKFLEHTQGVRINLPMDLDVAAGIVNERRESRVQSRRLNKSKKERLELIDMLIQRDDLFKTPRDGQTTWRRYFLFNELKNCRVSDKDVSVRFGCTRRAVRYGIESITNEKSRRLHEGMLGDYEQLFKRL